MSCDFQVKLFMHMMEGGICAEKEPGSMLSTPKVFHCDRNSAKVIELRIAPTRVSLAKEVNNLCIGYVFICYYVSFMSILSFAILPIASNYHSSSVTLKWYQFFIFSIQAKRNYDILVSAWKADDSVCCSSRVYCVGYH